MCNGAPSERTTPAGRWSSAFDHVPFTAWPFWNNVAFPLPTAATDTRPTGSFGISDTRAVKHEHVSGGDLLCPVGRSTNGIPPCDRR